MPEKSFVQAKSSIKECTSWKSSIIAVGASWFKKKGCLYIQVEYADIITQTFFALQVQRSKL